MRLLKLAREIFEEIKEGAKVDTSDYGLGVFGVLPLFMPQPPSEHISEQSTILSEERSSSCGERDLALADPSRQRPCP